MASRKLVYMDEIRRAKDKLTRKVINQPGVTGVAVGSKASGRPCLMVYVSGNASGHRLPKSVLGLDVVVEETGPFKRQ